MSDRLSYVFEGLSLGLLAVLSRKAGHGKGNSIYVTSPHSGEGKTTVALSLAFTIANGTAERCVLVDANMERPAATQELLGTTDTAGLADAVRLRGQGELEPVTIQRSSLWLVPAGRNPQA